MYIVTGEPVGSKAIASLPDIRFSPATIRNDMAMLEQLGFLEQPHTSAGRIPTYSGYRLYIDELMNTRTLTDEDKKMLDECLEVDVPIFAGIFGNNQGGSHTHRQAYVRPADDNLLGQH